MRFSVVPLVLVGILAHVVPGQRDGDAVFTLSQFNTVHLAAMTPQGVGTTFATFPINYHPDGVTPAPDNNGVLAIMRPGKTASLSVVHIRNSGGVSTLATLRSSITGVPTLLVDQGGDILMLSGAGWDLGIFRMPAGGGPLTTVAHNQVNAAFTQPFAMAEDLVSGDLIVLDLGQKLHRVPPRGPVTTLKFVLPPSGAVNPPCNLHQDPDARIMHFTYTNYVMALNPAFGTTTTIFAPSFNKWKSYYGLDYDPRSRSYYVNFFQASPLPTGRFVGRFDPRAGTLTTISPIGVGFLHEVVSWNSRQLRGMTRPRWGQSYRMGLDIPAEAGKAYLAAAAMGFRQGIRIDARRRVPVDPDALFHLSLQVPSMFAGFQGALDSTGRANLAIKIPGWPSLQGFRFFLAAVTFDASGIRVITEPFGVTIE